MAKAQTLFLIALALVATASSRRVKTSRVAASMAAERSDAAADSNATTEVFSAVPGALLDQEYHLVELIKGMGNVSSQEGGASFLQQDKQKQWPRGFESLGASYGNDPKRAGEGAFGEVWLAQHARTGTNVAVKLFKNGRGGYIMCGAGNPMERMQYQQMLKDASDECKLAQRLTNGPEARRDPVGASRIAQCLKDEVSSNLNAQRVTPCYLVLENGGKPLNEWVESHKGRGNNDPREARIIMKEILQAVKFMNSFTPAYIHHDMKPDNTVLSMEGGKPVVKLIDWGCAIQASNPYQQSQVDPEYAPPEYSMTGGRQAFANPPSAFDMFQTGVTYAELLCPDMHHAHSQGVDMFGRQLPKTLWLRGAPSSTDFRNAGCCVNDNDPNRCITHRDIMLIGSMVGHSATRPHPNTVLHDQVFANLMTEQETLNDASKYIVNEIVEYYSSTYGQYVQTQITAVHSDGTYEIDVKPGARVLEYKLRTKTEIIQEATPDLQKMGIHALKQECEKRGIDTRGFLEKSELVFALEAKLRTDMDQKKSIQCPPGSVLYLSNQCICDAEKGFVLSVDGKSCEQAALRPKASAATADAAWCAEYADSEVFFTHMCTQQTVAKNCANACNP